MLKINNKKYKVVSSEIKYVNSEFNKEKWYSIYLNFNIELNGKNGYFKFYIDKFKDKDFNNIKNKKFIDLPTNFNSKINMIEIFDTNEFIDFIDSEAIVEFKNIINNKIETQIIINDEKIKLEYQGLIDIK